jgi:ABC-2 type transport system ATP-binding protein
VIGAVEDLLETHKVLTGPIEQADDIAGRMAVVSDTRASRSARMMVRTNDRELLPPDWQAECTNLEEIVLAYLRVPDVSALPGPSGRPDRVEERSA